MYLALEKLSSVNLQFIFMHLAIIKGQLKEYLPEKHFHQPNMVKRRIRNY